MTKHILNQRYSESQGTRTYDIRATMYFDENRISDERAKEIYIEFLKELTDNPKSLIVGAEQ